MPIRNKDDNFREVFDQLTMGRKSQRVSYDLNSGDIHQLSDEEIAAILRAADALIATGGRSMLSKILKGSKDKKLLAHELDQCPAYGYYKHLTLPEITKRVDWTIKQGYLEIEYSGQLPVLVFTPVGWAFERENYAEELLQKLTHLLKGEDYSFVLELKDRNREMILLLIEKIKATNNQAFIPLLQAWHDVDYKKMKAVLQNAITHLKK